MNRLGRNLVNSSIEAFILGMEVINKLSVSYRLESFVFLFCNSWELLLKAKLLRDGRKIFYRKKRNKPRRSLSLEDALNCVFTSVDDPIRLNIEEIKGLRDNAIHLVIPIIPADVMALFQAGVINYTKKLNEWFSIDISKRVPLGMMALVYDIDPSLHTLETPLIRRKLPKETLEWWRSSQQSVRAKVDSVKTGREEFYIPVNLKLAIVKNPNKADIVLSSGVSGKEAVIVEVPKRPDDTHPHRLKDLVQLVNQKLAGKVGINSYDVFCVRQIFGINDSKPQYYYKSKFGSPQYSDSFVNWLVNEYDKDSEFFNKAREKYKSATNI
jgi:hypothetical protein